MNTEWKPIESAPKDELILVGPTKRMGICVAMNHSRDGWVTETCNEWCSIYTPTHWMPLPAEPCLTCNDHGMIGGLTPHSGYDAEPCPDCSPPAPISHPIPTGATGEDERKAFEAWWRRTRGLTITKQHYFELPEVYSSWEAWQERAGVDAPAAGDALDLTLAQKYEDACIAANANARDAERWRAFERALRTRIAGPGHGTRIKVVKICPMFGEEKDVPDVRALIDAAIAQQKGEA